MDKEQEYEINLAKKEGLDISPMIYTKFRDCWQLEQIRIGLEHHIDVSPYSKPDYTWAQMREIRIGIEEGLPYQVYINPAYSYTQMRFIREGLENGVDITPYIDPNYTINEMEDLFNQLCQNK